MEDETRRLEVELADLGKALRAAVNCRRRTSDFEIREERHVALGFARNEAKVDVVTTFFVAMGKPASVGDQLRQGRLLMRHRSACGQSCSLLQGAP